jgi:hypothetical protein
LEFYQQFGCVGGDLVFFGVFMWGITKEILTDRSTYLHNWPRPQEYEEERGCTHTTHKAKRNIYTRGITSEYG